MVIRLNTPSVLHQKIGRRGVSLFLLAQTHPRFYRLRRCDAAEEVLSLRAYEPKIFRAHEPKTPPELSNSFSAANSAALPHIVVFCRT
jgi:hypothetical protein